MKPRTLTIVAIITVAIVTYWLAFRRPVPKIDAPTAAKLSSICDWWCIDFVDEEIPRSKWPDEIRRLDPKSVRAKDEGIYIKRGSMFIEEWGVFILKSDSTMNPQPSSDPSFRQLQGRVYWYEIKG